MPDAGLIRANLQPFPFALWGRNMREDYALEIAQADMRGEEPIGGEDDYPPISARWITSIFLPLDG